MTHFLRTVALGLGAVLAASPAAADCTSSLVALKAQIARDKTPEVLAATRKHVARAEKERRGSESECRNAVTRGWRALAAAKEAAEMEAKNAAAKRRR